MSKKELLKHYVKTTYEVVVHFNENATETMQDKLTRIMLREFRRESDEKKMILIKKSLTSSNRENSHNTYLLFIVLHAVLFYLLYPKNYCKSPFSSSEVISRVT